MQTSNSNCEDYKSLLTKYFLSSTSAQIILRLLDNRTLNEESQDSILLATVHHPLAIKYPPSKSYIEHILKKIIKKVEDGGCAVSENMYIAYAKLVSTPEADPSTCFYSYIINNDTIITLQESTSLVSHSTTGLCTWEAGKYLSEWNLENASLFKGRRIVELGSGIGLVGLLICKLCHPASYTFTDCSPEVLKQLKKNINLNISLNKTNDQSASGLKHDASNVPFSKNLSICSQFCTYSDSSICDLTKGEDVKTICIKHNGLKEMDSCQDDGMTWKCYFSEDPKFCTSISVEYLNWEEATEEEILRFQPDIILASDVTYDREVIIHLVHVLHTLLSSYRSTAFIACTVRHEDTVNCFLQELGSVGLKYSLVPRCQTNLFCYEINIPINLYKIENIQ